MTTTTCPVCGAAALEADGVLYDPLSRSGVMRLHGCVAPDAGLPPPDGEAYTYRPDELATLERDHHE